LYSYYTITYVLWNLLLIFIQHYQNWNSRLLSLFCNGCCNQLQRPPINVCRGIVPCAHRGEMSASHVSHQDQRLALTRDGQYFTDTITLLTVTPCLVNETGSSWPIIEMDIATWRIQFTPLYVTMLIAQVSTIFSPHTLAYWECAKDGRRWKSPNGVHDPRVWGRLSWSLLVNECLNFDIQN